MPPSIVCRRYVHPHARTHTHTFLVSTLLRTLRMAQGTKSAHVICHVPPHLPTPVSFLCTMCSPPAPTSPPSASSTSTARIRPRSRRESGPLTDFAPNTGYEPNLSAKVADSFSNLDFMHIPTAFLERPHEFSCSNNVAMIPATQGLVQMCSVLEAFGKAVCECHVSVCTNTGKRVRRLRKNLLRQHFPAQYQKGNVIDTKMLCIR